MRILLLLFLCLNTACTFITKHDKESVEDTSNGFGKKHVVEFVPADAVKQDTVTSIPSPSSSPQIENEINTGSTSPAELVAYAKTLIGTPYLYGSTDPSKGFDCSGFITYVFNHFNTAVPRSSVDFTDVPDKVPLHEARPGDLILFTGTDSTIRIVGHMGIITENNRGDIKFIHSTSGKQYGVTITPLEKYYMGRFVKVIRIFNNNW